jgi:alkanesulfonate monooxygenase SsuD/methylene tetrahydromethanopterin reductase-like flavin-dependent oxidoreductase (luciferase family)
MGGKATIAATADRYRARRIWIAEAARINRPVIAASRMRVRVLMPVTFSLHAPPVPNRTLVTGAGTLSSRRSRVCFARRVGFKPVPGT